MVRSDPDRVALPGEDYRFALGISPGNAEAFFGPSPDREWLLAERARWLTSEPGWCVAALPDSEASLAEVEALSIGWGCLPVGAGGGLLERLAGLSRQVEPDLVLLAPDGGGRLVVVGGSVCFPSYWRLTDKLGLPVDAVHAPVPGLNASLGGTIDRLLSRMKPGSCWTRANWGLASMPDLNEHPDRRRYAWERPLSLERVWIRREDQAIVSLPASGGVLFGIRVVVRSLAEVARSAEKLALLGRGLRTMPAEMVRYKGLSDVRGELLELLAAASAESCDRG